MGHRSAIGAGHNTEINKMSRIQLTDSVMDMLIKMAEGNPGAIDAMLKIIEKSAEIDPQSAMPSIMPILAFDTHGIYGSSIYVLYSDKCGRDVRKVLVLLRAVQLGLMPESKLQELCFDQARKINLTDDEFNSIDAEVCEQLADFQKPEKIAA
jgi:hypothetical protein